jgi:ATP-dependent helicase/nuclease subunit A
VIPASDARGRREALDPGRSFIVEAPAGSGKTELLIQRFLRLLPHVERPEQIVAITFTRKAAAEMRERVVDTLEAAATGVAVPRHREASIELARSALAHAERSGWSLTDQPRRLRIMTIDALNTGLARQLPILAGGIASLTVADDATELYALAAQRTTESLADGGPLGDALRALLAAADNSLGLLEERLAGSLAQRDRWIRALAESPGNLAESVSATLMRLGEARLAAVRRLVGEQEEARLFEILGQRHDAAAASARPAFELGSAVFDDAADAAEAARSRAAAWRGAARLLLTEKREWRRRFTRREGFPADDKPLRRQLEAALARLQAIDGLHESLVALVALPPATLSPDHADRLHAIERVLPRLLAELKVLFAERGGVDYTELSLAAQEALGAIDSPSELLLALDRRVEHILVDEFQDTSRLQWRLLERLTSGWQPGDGRTLFLVGDPMQSIYRFRDADLSLFLRARREGLGGVALTPVTLIENHRSSREIVDWVNTVFAGVFAGGGEARSIESTAPGFHASISSRAPDPGAGVELTVLAAGAYETEIAEIVGIVQDVLARGPDQSIGILVRSRTHLLGLRAALRRRGVHAHAVEIDSLTDTQLGQDLIGLTQALAHPGDRLAWLGLLRGPWCGLSWADLLALADDADDRIVTEQLDDPGCLARLSTEGRRRAEWLAGRLRDLLPLRATRSFGRWVRECWIAIDGPAALGDGAELEIVEGYFAQLEPMAQAGDVDDPAVLRRHFGTPASAADAPLASGVEIMTMHRAKGLEFDCVVLPALGRITRGNDSKLLYGLDFDLDKADESSLMAAGGRESDPVLDYVSAIDREREAEERCRLLYVAATRARRRLCLIGSVDAKTGKPRANSLLATLWPGLAEPPPTGGAAADAARTATVGPAFLSLPLKRLDFDRGLPAIALGAEDAGVAARPEFEWVHPASVQVGTLIHRELQRVAENASRAGCPVPPAIDLARFERRLALLGVEREDLPAAAERVAEALENAWSDDHGRWVLKPWPLAWSELRLTLRDHGRLEHVQLDRSFVDDEGVRWIIDYKTGRHLGGDVEGFLDAEVERYRGQLERYARVVAEFDARPIRVGLYFPLMRALRSWAPAVLEADAGTRR